MIKYKLIKEYSGGPKLGTVKTEEEWCAYLNYHRINEIILQEEEWFKKLEPLGYTEDFKDGSFPEKTCDNCNWNYKNHYDLPCLTCHKTKKYKNWQGELKGEPIYEGDSIYLAVNFQVIQIKNISSGFDIKALNHKEKLFSNKKNAEAYYLELDEQRIQNIPQVLEQFKDKEVYVTEKIDYQSVTFTGKLVPRFNDVFSKLPFKKYQFVVCSRNLTTNDKNSLYWKIAKKYNIEQILKENPTLTIQGEQGDIKVQGNKYGIKEPIMWVFNIIDHEKNYHYGILEMETFCNKYKLQTIPYLQVNKLSTIGSTVQELVEFSKGKSTINPKIEKEGVVIRCIESGKKLLSFEVKYLK